MNVQKTNFVYIILKPHGISSDSWAPDILGDLNYDFIHVYVVVRIHHILSLLQTVLSGLFQLWGGRGRLLSRWLMQAYGGNIAVLS